MKVSPHPSFGFCYSSIGTQPSFLKLGQSFEDLQVSALQDLLFRLNSHIFGLFSHLLTEGLHLLFQSAAGKIPYQPRLVHEEYAKSSMSKVKSILCLV